MTFQNSPYLFDTLTVLLRLLWSSARKRTESVCHQLQQIRSIGERISGRLRRSQILKCMLQLECRDLGVLGWRNG